MFRSWGSETVKQGGDFIAVSVVSVFRFWGNETVKQDDDLIAVSVFRFWRNETVKQGGAVIMPTTKHYKFFTSAYIYFLKIRHIPNPLNIDLYEYRISYRSKHLFRSKR